MRPNGPSQTAQRLGAQCRAFRVKLGISVSSHLRVSPDQPFAVPPSREAGSGSLSGIAPVQVIQLIAPQCFIRLG